MNVSIVIPAHNAARWIGEALASVCAQTHSGWEAIVVDDGSTDETGAVATASATADARVRVVRQANAGEAGARNTGIAHARYDWLLFLDADDWIAPSHLERLTEALASHPDWDAVHCGSVRVARDGTLVSDGYQAPAGDLFPTLACRAAFPVHACLVRKSIVEAVGGFDVSFAKSADWDLWQRVARAGARFGAVRDVLAYYRMQPQSASLDAERLLADGLRVLRQGHAPDPRVPRPDPRHAQGAPPGEVACQQFYLLSWCAGLAIGHGHDAIPLIAMMGGGASASLYPDAVARCLFESATLPACETAAAWDRLWTDLGPRVEAFLAALEARSGTPHLTANTLVELKEMVLRASPVWRPAIARMEASRASLAVELAMRDAHIADTLQRCDLLQARTATLEHDLRESREQHTAARAESERMVRAVEEELAVTQRALAALRHDSDELRERLEATRRLAHDRRAMLDDLERRAWVRLGRRAGLLSDRWRSVGASLAFQLQLARLRVERLVDRLTRPGRQRVLATACWQFPIYSQTFVYQELTQLIRSGRRVRFVYGDRNRRDPLPPQFGSLWRARRRFFVDPAVCRRSREYFARRAPDRVEGLVAMLSRASGLPLEQVRGHYHLDYAFAFARLAEAYRPDYLHSYFFYEGSLFALAASHLLDIPRGVSCYADHMLRDYEMKVVPLHLRQCSVVVATSERIKDELLGIEPGADPECILVKPNGINVDAFPFRRRRPPSADAPFRVVSVCRVEPKKGLLYLVEAVARLRDQGRDVVLHLVGGVDDSDGSREYHRDLCARISRLGLDDRVRLEGRRSEADINALFGEAHLFAAPYVETASGDKDGIPTSLLEAMSSGLPIVATDAGSIGEVITDGRDGVLVPQRDAAALADAIAALMRDPDRCAALGAHATQRVREAFDAGRCDRHFHARLDVLARGPAAARDGVVAPAAVHPRPGPGGRS